MEEQHVQPLGTSMVPHALTQLDSMLIRRNFWTVFGAKFRIFDPSGSMIAMCKQKAFKLKEDIRIYADAAMSQELLFIGARQVIDFSAAYDIIDSTTGEKVGALRRRGMKSILKDEWLILDVQDQQIGTVKEDSGGMAFLRRFVSNLIPQKFQIDLMGAHMGSVRQHFNPFIFKATMDLSADTQRVMDRRLAVATAVLLLAIEGRQQ
jgi:hypothetical protein